MSYEYAMNRLQKEYSGRGTSAHPRHFQLLLGRLDGGRERTAELVEQLIADTAAKEGIELGVLTLHADRGSSMRSKPAATLLSDLGITKSHGGACVSADNPYSEAQFKALKY